MVKTAAVLLGATLAAALGAALHVRAYTPWFGWQSPWPAPLNRVLAPAAEEGLLLTGVLLLATGLALVVVTAHRRLSAAAPPPGLGGRAR